MITSRSNGELQFEFNVQVSGSEEILLISLSYFCCIIAKPASSLSTFKSLLCNTLSIIYLQLKYIVLIFFTGFLSQSVDSVWDPPFSTLELLQPQLCLLCVSTCLWASRADYTPSFCIHHAIANAAILAQIPSPLPLSLFNFLPNCYMLSTLRLEQIYS